MRRSASKRKSRLPDSIARNTGIEMERKHTAGEKDVEFVRNFICLVGVGSRSEAMCV